MKILIVIPARFASTRFPGKPLALLANKPLIQWAYENASGNREGIPTVIATDDKRIASAVKKFGGNVVITSPKHPSGTDRVMEAVQKYMPDADAVINLQGDEPFVPAKLLSKIIQKIKTAGTEIVTVAVKTPRKEIAQNPNSVKVVMNSRNEALYFSRAPIPFLRDGGIAAAMYRHWGIYAFKREAINKFVSLPESNLEKCERLEQLRALENGIKISVIISNYNSIGVDTVEDLKNAEKFIALNRKKKKNAVN